MPQIIKYMRIIVHWQYIVYFFIKAVLRIFIIHTYIYENGKIHDKQLI